MTTYLECDWCGERIELKAEYSADEYNRMGLEETPEGATHVVMEARVAGKDRHGYRKAERRVDGHFHHPDCYSTALGLLRDHRRWAKTQGTDEMPGWDRGELDVPVTEAEVERPTIETREVDWERMRRRAAAGTPLLSVGLVNRASSAMWQAGIATVEDLAEWAEIDVLALDGVGGGSLERLKEAMANAGVEFRSDVVGPLELGRRLRMLRETSGLTTSDISHALRDSGATDDWQVFTNWQAGRQTPTQTQRVYLARLLGVDVDELIRREEAS